MKTLLLLTLAAVSTFASPGDVRWKFKADAAIRSSPALGTNGWIIFGTLGGNAYAIDPATQETKWQTQLGKSVVSSACIREDGAVLIGAGKKLYALDGLTGQELWHFQAPTNGFPPQAGEVLSTPSLGAQDTAYFALSTGTIVALDRTGAELWITNLFGSYYSQTAAYSSPVVDPLGRIIVGSTGTYQPSGGAIWAFDASGRLAWTQGTPNWVQSSAAIGADGTIYFSGNDKLLYAIDPNTGTNKWTHLTFDSMTSSPVISPDGILYVGANDGRMYALDAKTGTEKWHYNTFDSIHSTPAIAADGTIYFGSYDRHVYALDGKTGAKIWTFKTDHFVLSSPLIGGDGTVYIGSFDGHLYAFEGTAPLAAGPWPMFKGNPRHTGVAPSW